MIVFSQFATFLPGLLIPQKDAETPFRPFWALGDAVGYPVAMEPIRELIEQRELRELKRALDEASVLEIVEELSRLSQPERAVAFRLLPKDRAIVVFEAFDPPLQSELLESLRETKVRELVEQLDPDDRARLVDEMPASVASKLLAGLSPEERRLTSILLGYADESAGRVMTPEFVSLKAGMSVKDALARVRRAGTQAETIYMLPVTDDDRRLIGSTELRDLVLAPEDATVGSLLSPEVYAARVDDDQEVAARLLQEAEMLALPVVDTERRLVGVITVDDAMRVLESEDSEDLARAGGSEPLDRPYMSSTILQLARRRVVWLLVLIVAATLTVNVLSAFEATLEAVITLALFIPLLIDTGGNAGAQSATTIIRAMALGEVTARDVGRVVLREARVGLIMGAVLGIIGFLPITLIFDNRIAQVVSISLVAVCTLASFVGAFLPLAARRVGVDPAIVSAPFITTIVDATGLLVYFLIARLILGV